MNTPLPVNSSHLQTSDFDYLLPPELIAQQPLPIRDHSRLLVADRLKGSIQHRRFHQIVESLQPGDLLVFNDSRVLPARLYGHKHKTGGAVELLLLHSTQPNHWEALVRPGRRVSAGAYLEFSDKDDQVYRAVVVEDLSEGRKIVRFEDEQTIEACGTVPLPPYIHQSISDPERYQTVYARVPGSSAAPTAGLHFTEHLLQTLAKKGIDFAMVTLHTGLDTFRPVQTENPIEHKIHKEFATLGDSTARAITQTRERGGRVISVGTTSTRVLESAALHNIDRTQPVSAYSGWTDLFILPGHEFRIVDGLITNFHLPRSTLLMLISAFAGSALTTEAYATAVRHRYRFYSFGDAMLII